MNDKNRLNYFPDSMKDELDFNNSKDFKLPAKHISKNLPKFVLENVKTNLNIELPRAVELEDSYFTGCRD